MPNGLTPKDGDVVVRQVWREGKVFYLLTSIPRPDQFLLHSRQEAVRQAVTFAKRQRVRAWFADDGHDFELLEDWQTGFKRSAN